MRFLAVSGVPLGVLCCVLACACACGAGGGVPAAGPRPTTVASSGQHTEKVPPDDRDDGLAEALGVLREWDARRAAAWREQDLRALGSLYVSGAPAAAADERLLRAYTDRGLVVRRLDTQVFAARVLHRSPRALRLLVHDRVAGGSVQGRSGQQPLRSSAPARRVLELRLVAGRWRMASVSAKD